MTTKKGLTGRRLFGLCVVALLAGMVSFAALVLITPLPQPVVPTATKVYDRKGELVASVFVENRIEIPFSEMPQHLRDAVVAIEDYRFYQHLGIDPVGLARALYHNIRAGRVVEGGSTITQQLAKNLFLTPERTLRRKFLEAVLTEKLEIRYSKDEILKMYLNTIYFGEGAYGVEVASQTYFGKHARDLDLAESALLAGLIRSPETYSPFKNPKGAKARQHMVLDRMVEVGYITREEAQRAKAEEIEFAEKSVTRNFAPYFVQYVTDVVRRIRPDITEADLARSGFVIRTTLDLRMQRAAQRALDAGLGQGTPDQRGVRQPQGALVAIDPRNGEIRAMVGGRSFFESTWNRAVLARRQPGSAFKPFLYAAVLSAGYPPTSRQMCAPVSFPGGKPGEVWTPTDYRVDYHYREMTIREAIKISDNVVAAKWASIVGPGRIARFASAMGIRSRLDINLSLALGTSPVTPLEMAAAYAPLANGGIYFEPTAVIEVKGPGGEDLIGGGGVTVPRKSYRAIDESTAYVLTSLMKSVLEPGGTAGHVGWRLGRPAAGKTGTTDLYRDAWFIGYTPDLVAAVYVGNDDVSKPVGRSGGSIAAPIWADFMVEALRGEPPRDFPMPPGVVVERVCSVTGLRAGPTCPSYDEVFIRGTEPAMECPGFHWWADQTTSGDEGEGVSPGTGEAGEAAVEGVRPHRRSTR
ncbi:MAG TPA: PBP1A family penicillin-binding protein [Clostridia bacterium]|nr:PBP1A family penicillin-binding protein [Clostridia bacterium]